MANKLSITKILLSLCDRTSYFSQNLACCGNVIDIMSEMYCVTIRWKKDCTNCKHSKSRLNTEREWHGPLQDRLSGKSSVSPRCHATSSPDRLLAQRTTFHLIYNVTPVLCDLPPPPAAPSSTHKNHPSHFRFLPPGGTTQRAARIFSPLESLKIWTHLGQDKTAKAEDSSLLTPKTKSVFPNVGSYSIQTACIAQDEEYSCASLRARHTATSCTVQIL